MSEKGEVLFRVVAPAAEEVERVRMAIFREIAGGVRGSLFATREELVRQYYGGKGPHPDDIYLPISEWDR